MEHTTNMTSIRREMINQFRYVCKLVINYCPGEYAKAYARRGMDMITDQEINAQCLYILSNMRSWRGPLATMARDGLKQIERETRV